MTCKLSEEDFEVLKEPLKSGRQAPNTIAGTLFLTIFLQAILFALEYFAVSTGTIYPFKDEILTFHLWGTGVLVVLSLLYSIPAVYKRSDKMQYLVSILVSQNLFSITFLILSLFIVGNESTDGDSVSSESLLNFTIITLGIGLLIFIVTFIRFYILLGKESIEKDQKKMNFEHGLKRNHIFLWRQLRD